jgi:hypothetical protein
MARLYATVDKANGYIYSSADAGAETVDIMQTAMAHNMFSYARAAEVQDNLDLFSKGFNWDEFDEYELDVDDFGSSGSSSGASEDLPLDDLQADKEGADDD